MPELKTKKKAHKESVLKLVIVTQIQKTTAEQQH